MLTQHPNKTHREGLTKQDRIGLVLGGMMGTMYAFYALAVINFGWMLWQTFIAKQSFDPYPFAFLLFCSNIIQSLWLPILNVYQNVLSKHGEIKADADYQIDVETEKRLERIEAKLDALK